MPPKKDFLSIGIVYAAGQILLQSISFFLLPLYTHYLSTDQYGQFSITTTISDVIGFLLVLGIYSGYFRFYKDYSPVLRIKLRNTAFTFAMIVGPVLVLLVIATAKWVEGAIPQIDHLYTIITYIAINNLCIQISTIFICDYYLEYNAKKIIVINLVKAACSVLLIVYFLVIRSSGIAGIYQGQMIASFGQLLYFIENNRKSLKLVWERKMLRQMLKFGVGLIPSNLSASALNFSDRFFMAGYRSFDETGIYSVGYKIGMQIDPLFTTPFRQIFTTYKYETWKDNDSGKIFNNMFLQYHVLGCFFILCISVLSRTAIFIFTKSEYLTAYKIVPFILVAYFLYGETRFFNLGIELKNKTYLDSIILISGGVLNLILNLVLIPGLGMEGAAYSTVISYILILVLYAEVSGRLYRVKYDFKKPCVVCVLTAVLYFGYYVFSLFVPFVLYDLVLAVLLPAAYVLLCLEMGIVSRNQIRNLVKSLPKILQKDKL